jgi:hypothetical protein
MKWLQRHLPSREALEANRWLRPFAHQLASPLVWRFNRRGVARGVALGLFAAFAVPVAQTPFAAAFALGLRANLPVAALSTFVTNPLTMPVFWVLAYQAGDFFLAFRARADQMLAAKENAVDRMADAAIGAIGTTYLGLILFALASALVGYALTHWGWRLRVTRKWNRRRSQRRSLLLEARG